MTRVLLVALAATLAVSASAHAFSAGYEANNYRKINERAATDYTPEFNLLLAQEGLANEAAAASIMASDGPTAQYGRTFNGNLCGTAMNGCAGDVRLYHWGEKGYGLVEPVLFTARNGSTISGHVWRTKAGPSTRPGVVITNGSVQAPETLYWYAAQTLAKAGFVVLTWDPQGQGFSDTYGEGADRNDGFPSQSGGPFFTGTEDALDFFFSTPANPYIPRKSCTTGTSHADKQAARVGDGRSSAFNPFFASLDTSRVGIAGHSLGASAVSFIGQLDPRVKAIVAWDNLRDVSSGGGTTCAGAPYPAKLAITKPTLGMSNDYSLVPTPYRADPNPVAQNAGSLAATKAGVDNGQLNTRGGTHYEYSYIPNPAFGATRRGMDMAAWYTLAWMDKYVKGDASADARLLTTRWRNDRLEGEVDSQNPADPNLFSTYLKSRLDITTGGARFVCEDVRKGCTGMGPDNLAPDYSFIKVAQTADPDPVQPGVTPTPTATPQPSGGSQPGGATDTPPAASGPPAVDTISQAGGCRPSSKITRIRRKGRGPFRFSGRSTPSPICKTRVVAVRLIVRQAGHRTRRIPVSGVERWKVTLSLQRGRYAIQARARALDNSVEANKRGHRFRVRRSSVR